ncbi:hypothetical protein CALCODRAFT_498816 [Calocera cornea HHB12733]|uniref:GAR domain-containing protein n=1 Tax=Calocera cornea HHB12733 TaxID=1353952 RepID=A0A165EQK0_9BASI|nr:hypothetical protein CALCODRAFT_498816 [Calocera cornea HHB12733]
MFSCTVAHAILQYLESLTPLEPLRTDTLQKGVATPELPTLDEIRSWVRELRVLEKETDQFDSVDLKRLRQTARGVHNRVFDCWRSLAHNSPAAANRHLTPEDTDLVDLTLSTLLALDHLLEAIQQRSEQLDLFAHRVRWEDQCNECEAERLALLSDLNSFITGPARWSPNAYEEASVSGSVAYLEQAVPSTGYAPVRAGTPAFSQTSSSRSTPTTAFPTSRSQRFNLGQSLAADASRLYMRACNLRQGRVEVAGKLLDRVISLKKVPDQFLDEQDRLENETDYLRRSLGEFSLALAEQWIIADRVYSDCVKHQSEAHAIIADLGRAAMKPPNQRLHASLVYRMTTLETRLSTTAYDVLIFRYIPQPTHPSFPEQEQLNEQIAQKLSEELETAQNLGRIASNSVQEYHKSLKVLHRAEKIKEELGLRRSQVSDLIVKLLHGTGAPGDDGSAPDLSTEACLEPGRHGAYMAALPDLLREIDEACRSVDRLVRTARAHLPALKTISLSPGYMDNCIQSINSLDAERNSLVAAHASASSLSVRFKITYQAWMEMQDIRQSCQNHQTAIQDGLQYDRWRPASPTSSETGPPTPTTPSSHSFVDSTSPLQVMEQLDILSKRFRNAVQTPMQDVLPAIGDRLQSHFDGTMGRLKQDLSNLRKLAELWYRVRSQANSMKEAMDEAAALEAKILSLLAEVANLWTRLPDAAPIPDFTNSIDSLRDRHCTLRQEVETFSTGLAPRIPFVTSHAQSASSTYNVLSPKSSATLSMPQTPPDASVNSSLPVPFDPTGLDEAIRAEVNVRSASLNGALHNVERRLNYLDEVQEVRRFDECLGQAAASLEGVFLSLNARTDAIVGLAAKEAAESTEDIQVALEALNSEAALLLAFASGVDELLHDIITPPLQALDRLARDTHGEGREEIAGLLRSRQSRLRNFEAQEDQLREDTASALRQLRNISSALAKRLSILEQEQAERETILRKQEQLEAQEQVRKLREERDRTAQEELMMASASSQQDSETAELSYSNTLTTAQSSEAIALPSPDSPDALLVAKEALDSHEEQRIAPEALSGTEAIPGADVIVDGNQSYLLSSPPVIMLPSVIVTGDPQPEGDISQDRILLSTQHFVESQPLEHSLLDLSVAPQAESVEVSPMLSASVAAAAEMPSNLPVVEEGQDDEDVFGQFVSMPPRNGLDAPSSTLQELTGLRIALGSLKVQDLAQSTAPETQFGILPTESMVNQLNLQVATIQEQVRQLNIPDSDHPGIADRDTLQQDLNIALGLFPRLHSLAAFVAKADECDAGINDIIAIMDDYPDPQPGTRSSKSSQETAHDQLRQLIGRVATLVQTVMQHGDELADDFRVVNERIRIEQTWAEARDEANDRLDPAFVRTNSTLSLSSLSSSTSSHHLSTPIFKKSTLSRQSSTSMLSGRSSVLSASTGVASGWAGSNGFKPTARSVSGPLPRTPASRLPRPTESPTPTSVLRQRTESVNSMYSQRPRQSLDSSTPVWARGISDARRRKSSISAEVTPTRPRNLSMSSSWSRTPRQSFGSPMLPTRESTKKRRYVANPKNKLDVAVGNVINRLPVNVDVRPLPGWRDQSGKYFIGDANSKPYFCRILRSQTVMVRVGGGWMELSK